MFTVEFKGGKEIEKALFELKTATAKSTVRRVLKKSAQPLADLANSLAPKSETPSLAQSYTVGTRLSRRQFGLADKEGRGDVFMYVGTLDPAGIWQEFGTRFHRPQPHFRPAWEMDRAAMLGRLSDELAEQVGKAVARARKKAAKLKK